MKLKQRIIYYKDEQNDEFSKAKIKARPIDGSYRYVRSRFLSFILYRIIATPLAFLYTKLVFGQKTVGREKWAAVNGSGAFLYGNHTQASADPLIPNLIRFPGKVYTICHPANVSMPVFGRLMPYVGAIPLPDGMAAYRNFIACITQRIDEKAVVTVYPEAHIWPYYTKIRPFPDTSFTYPAQLDKPVYCFTNTYKARKIRKKPRIVSYLDGPFYPDRSLPVRQRAAALREEVYR
ncbi:MAG: hypothetical protein J5843_05205, partial [Clostridia bacterium]|nr:hypothetical protein [Clostridia bacterium]